MNTEKEKEKSAFVLMPFDQVFDGVFRDLIVPVLESVGYRVSRADSFVDQQNILKDIVSSIDRADLIIAELTNLNPNVFYELGIAHGLNKPTILLTQSIEKVPFDLRSYRIIVYSTHYNEVKLLQEPLREIAQRTQDGTINFGNPVSDFAPSMQIRDRSESGLDSTRKEDVLDNVENEALDNSDLSNQFEHSLQQHREYGREMLKMVNTLCNQLNKHIIQMDLARKGSSDRQSQTAGKIKADINKLITTLKGDLKELSSSLEALVDKTTDLISTTNVADLENPDSMLAMTQAMQELQAAFSKDLARIHAIAKSIMPMKEGSYELGLAVGNMQEYLTKVAEELAIGEAYAARMQNLLNQQLSFDEENPDDTPSA